MHTCSFQGEQTPALLFIPVFCSLFIYGRTFFFSYEVVQVHCDLECTPYQWQDEISLQTPFKSLLLRNFRVCEGSREDISPPIRYVPRFLNLLWIITSRSLRRCIGSILYLLTDLQVLTRFRPRFFRCPPEKLINIRNIFLLRMIQKSSCPEES